MEPEITPEPSPEEREAILRALARVRRADDEDAWWRSGLDEELERPHPPL